MVTEVTPVSVAALQAPLGAGYRREDTLNEAGQRHRPPEGATSGKEMKSGSTATYDPQLQQKRIPTVPCRISQK